MPTIFPRPIGVVPIQQTRSANAFEAQVHTADELLSALTAIPSDAYGYAIIISGRMTLTSTVVINKTGLTIKGSGFMMMGDFAGVGLQIDSVGVAVEGITIQHSASTDAVNQTLIKSTGAATRIAGVRIPNGTGGGTFPCLSFTRPCMVHGVFFFSTVPSGVGILVTGGANTHASIIGNELSTNDIDTSAGQYSVIDGNMRCGTIINDATDHVGLNT